MERVQIVGVPEHFNMPWHFAIEEGAFTDRGIELIWNDVPEGTGRMCQLLGSGETDLAIILTEGLCKAIHDGLPAKILQEYIETPLLWGVHVGCDSKYRAPADLEGRTAAISRMGSGSHLMAFVWARSMDWDPKELDFLKVNTLEGAITALTQGEADFFMWEHFTTQPYVDQNIFRRLADCPTPWPCFVIAASQRFIDEKEHLISHILEVINLYTLEFKRIPSIDRTFSNRYQIALEDIRAWMKVTRWSQSQINMDILDNVINTLFDLNLILDKLPADSLMWKPKI